MSSGRAFDGGAVRVGRALYRSVRRRPGALAGFVTLTASLSACQPDDRPAPVGDSEGTFIGREPALAPLPAAAVGAVPVRYPETPYGTDVLDTVEDLSFRGWRHPVAANFSQASLETIRFSDYYEPERGQSGVLLLNTTAAWCESCRVEHRELAEQLARPSLTGLVVLSILYHDESFESPGPEDLENWAREYAVSHPFVLDPEHAMGRYGAAEVAPLNLVVDRADMRLLEVFVGNQPAVMWPFIERELAARPAGVERD